MLLKNGGAHASRYRPSVRVDLVLLVVHDGALRVLLEERKGPPFRGYQVLPGCSLRQEESLDDAARRVMQRVLPQGQGHLHQLHTYGEPTRDPRGHVLSVAYLGLAESRVLHTLPPHYQLGRTLYGHPNTELHVLNASGVPLHLGFDHHQIISQGIHELTSRLVDSPFSYALLAPEFTLRELRLLHEIILNEQFNKDNFRRKIIATGRLEETGRRQTDVGYRPAKLYRVAH